MDKNESAGSAIAALRISQFLFTALVENGAISKDLALSMLIRATAENAYNGEAGKYAQRILGEMQEWLEKRP